MRDRAADMPTQPLPVLRPARALRRHARRLALLTCVSWLLGAGGIAAQCTALTVAPALVRDALWSLALACLTLGFCALACSAASAALAAGILAARSAEQERRALYAAEDTMLSAQSERYRSLAERAAALRPRVVRRAQDSPLRLLPDRESDHTNHGAAG